MRAMLGMLVAGTMAVAGASWAGDAKIVVVDLNALIKAHPDTPPSEMLLEKQAEDMEAEKKEMLEKREELKKAFEKAREEAENQALSDEGRKQKEKDAEERFVELRRFEQDIKETQSQRQQELRDRGRRMRDKIVEELKTVVKEHASKKGYDIVINAGESALMGLDTVLYRSEAVDVTAELVELVKQLEPAKLKSEAAAPPKE